MGKVGLKSETLRGLDIEQIRSGLLDNGVTPDTFPELQGFWKAMDDFVAHGWGCSDHVNIPKIHRRLEYRLCTRENVDSVAVLRWTGA